MKNSNVAYRRSSDVPETLYMKCPSLPSSAHFGRCPYYTLVEIEDNGIRKTSSLQNPYYSTHGEPGQVPNFIKKQRADVIIAGGMGPRAIGFFDKLGIKVATEASGNVAEVVDSYLKGNLKDSGPCR